MFINPKEVEKASTEPVRYERSESIIEKKNFREFLLLIRDLIVIFIVVIIIRTVFITPFRINGISMANSYHSGEYILVDKFSYFDAGNTFTLNSENLSVPTKYLAEAVSATLGKLPIHIGDPKRGDVIVIRPGVSREKEYYIKRVIGLPGDTIRFLSGGVFIKTPNMRDFVKIEEPYLSPINENHTELPIYIDHNEFQIPMGYYWVMGDNRTNSADSRSCFYTCVSMDEKAHFISRSNIIGRAFIDFGYFNLFAQSEGWMPKLGSLSWVYPPRLLNHPNTATYSNIPSPSILQKENTLSGNTGSVRSY